MQHSERERESQFAAFTLKGLSQTLRQACFALFWRKYFPIYRDSGQILVVIKKKISRSSDGHIQWIQNLNENPKSMLRTNYFPYCYYYYFIWNWKITWLCKKCTVYFIPLNWNSIAVLVKLDKVTGALSNLIKTLQKPYLIVKIPKQLYQILRKR